MSASSQPTMVSGDLRCQHNARILFEIPRLTLSAGHAIVITGASSVGGTALLRMLAGLVPAHGTTVDLGRGQQALSPYPAELRVWLTYVHQHPYLFHISIRANFAYGLITSAHRAVCAELDARVDDALRWADLQHVTDVPSKRPSGSEMQCLVLVRARVLCADVLLLDEPTSNLDGAACEQVIALVGELAARGRTLLMVCRDHELINLPGVVRRKLEHVDRQDRLEMCRYHTAQGIAYGNGLGAGDIRAGKQAFLQRPAQSRRSVSQQHGAYHPR